MAERMDRDRAQVERIGIRAASNIGRQARITAVHVYRAGLDPLTAADKILSDAKYLLAQSMLAAHLQGRRRTLINGAPQLRKVKLASASYDAAIDFLQRRLKLSESDLLNLERTYSIAAEKMLTKMKDVLRSHVQKALQSAVSKQAHVKTGIAMLRDAFDQAGVTPQNSYTLENIFRTQAQVAYSAGRWNGLQDQDIQEILWGFKYVTVGDDRVRPTHRAMDGVTLPKDDPWWRSNMPPNGYSCRCSALEIYRNRAIVEPVAKMVDGAMTLPDADPGFAFNPGLLYRDFIAA